MKRKGLLDTMLLRTLIDALVDGAKHLFVARRAVCKVHRSIFARLRPEHAAGAVLALRVVDRLQRSDELRLRHAGAARNAGRLGAPVQLCRGQHREIVRARLRAIARLA
jgi:hypothetical protein